MYDNEADIMVANQAQDTDAGVCTAVVNAIAPTATADNCSIASVTYAITGATSATGNTDASGTTFNLGTSTVTYTITDGSGNTAQCSFDVVISDNEDPTISCVANQAQDTDAGVCTAVVNAIAPTATGDNCSIASVTYAITGATSATGNTDASGTTFNLGTSTVTYTITDGSGNTAQCSFDVVISDNEDPTISCVANQAQDTDAGVCTAVVNAIAPTATGDNCSIASVTYAITGATSATGNTDASGTTFNLGTSTVTYTITDGSGNTAQCSFDVVISDNEDPIAVCQDVTLNLDAMGQATLTAAAFDNGSSDNCGINNMTVSQSLFTAVGIYSTDLTVTDNSGNSNTVSCNVTITDNTAPVAICQDITVVLDATGNISITPAMIDNGSTDNGLIVSYVLDITNFDCDDLGANTVTLTVTDDGGNTDSCTATVTVEDNEVPVAICQDITVQLDLIGNASIVAADIENGSTDNCAADLTFGLNITAFDCTDVGANTVTLTATDGDGNSDTCTATVTVEDNNDPTPLCQDITVQLDAAGSATITTGDIDNGSNDECGIGSLSLDITSFDCTNVGANTVVLTVTDNNGNSSQCSATVTVEDNIDPQITCPADIVQNIDIGSCGAVVTFTAPVGTDNCAGSNTIQTSGLPSGSLFPIGTTTNCFEVTDASGNTASCCFDVTINDVQPSISISDETEDESVGNMVFTVSLSTIYCQDYIIDYATNDITAVDANDYTGVLGGSLTIPAGSSTGTISIPILEDNIDENSESFELNLTNSNLGSIADNQGIGTINDNDAAPQISINDNSIIENGGNVTLTLSLTNPSAFDIDVDYTTSDGDAISTNDYTTLAGTLTIPAGNTTATLSFTINDDLIDENDEVFYVDLTNPVNATISDNQGQITIIDNEGPPSLFIDDLVVDEGDGTVCFTVNLTSASGLDISFDYGQLDITATQGLDYSTISGLAETITAGNTSTNVCFTITDDNCNEFDEDFNIIISNPVNATISDDTNLTTITDNDPTPEVCINSVTVDEGDGIATLTLSLNSNSCLPVTVDYSTSDINAVAGADYTAVTTSTTIPANTLVWTIDIPILEDLLDEVNETFNVNLTGATNGTIGAACTGTVTITDNDVAPCISINDVTVDESAGTVSLTVTLDAISGQQVGFEYDVNDISTTSGSDYTAVGTTTSFIAIGDIDTTIVININEDLLDEIDETLSVDLSSPTNATICDSQGIVTITDNDATPCLSINDVIVDEADGTATFTVSLNTLSGQDVSVEYQLNDISANNPNDYSENSPVSPQLVLIPEGSLTGTITINIVDDLLNEIDEQFEVELLNPFAATLCNTTAVATITDNDAAPCLSINDVTVNEADGTATFTVSLDAPSGQTVNVDYDLNLVSTESVDQSLTSGTLTFVSGVLNQTIVVTINEDLLDEIDESYQVVLSNSINATLCGSGIGTGTIIDNDATPCVSITGGSFDESAGTVQFEICLDAVSGQDVTVSYDISDITTGTGSVVDVQLAATSVLIPEGSDCVSIDVIINEDLLDEIDEDFEVSLISAVNATVCAIGASATGTILDNDIPPCISINNTIVDESAGTATLTVSLDAVSGQDVFFDWTTNDQVALSVVDYVADNFNGFLIPEGSSSVSLNITINEDNIDEIDEHFELIITNPVNADLCGSSGIGSITILDNDQTPDICIDNVTVAEDAGTATLTLSLSNPSSADISVDINSVDNTATDGIDYQGIAINDTVITALSTSLSVVIPIFDDSFFETTEQINVILSDAINANILCNLGQITITDNEAVPCISISDISINETSQIAEFEICTDIASQLPIEFNFQTNDITAEAGIDYTDTSGLGTIAPLDTCVTISVPVIDDFLLEFTEQFEMLISSPSNAIICDDTGVVTINDDKAASTVSFDVESTTVDESAGLISIVVSNSTPNVQEIQVPLIITGTATIGLDYTIATDTITFAPAESVVNYEIDIIDDITYDIDEDIVLTFDIANITNAFAGSITEHTVSIVDNDCDEDEDGDGIPNCDELGDCNNNGVVDYLDFYDFIGDEDGDGVLNMFEDADGDGNPCNDDYDGDGVPNWVDLDSDADGYPDEMEQLNDDDNDGEYDFLDPYDPNGDNDGDCVLNMDEDPNGDGDPYNDDTDNDGILNLNDSDDDNDGIVSCDEDCDSGNNIIDVDTDNDGIPNYLDTDSDDDGIADSIEGTIDSDDDGIPNMCDWDSDNDGLDDEIEGSSDVDEDGAANYIDLDSDADGITDYINGIDDCDGDLIMNFLDADICDLIIPEAFSPNGDNIRDSWEIYPLDAYPYNYLEIYTRWGQKIYQAEPYLNDWSGVGPDGDLPTGTYFYILDLGDGSDVKTGYVYINRSR